MFKKGIDKSMATPYYYQIKQVLEEYIENEHKDMDAPIPTEESISRYFDVSRPTVRQAINELVVEGRLYRIKGKGTFIAKDKIYQEFALKIDSFANEMKRKGMIPRTEVLKYEDIAADAETALKMKIPEGAPLRQLVRLRYANAEPIVVLTSYLPHEMCKNITAEELVTKSLYDLLREKNDIVISSITRDMEARLATDYESDKMRIDKGSPIQYFETVAFDQKGRTVEFSKSSYRGDRNRFVLKLSKE